MSKYLNLIFIPVFFLFLAMFFMGSLVYLSDITDCDLWGSLGWVLRIVILSFGLYYIPKTLVVKVIRNKTFSDFLKSSLLSYYSMFYFAICIEFALTFYVQSTFHPNAYSNLNWYSLYWNPINSDNFRDKEFIKEKELLALFFGDSFTAGSGIKKIENRVSNLVEKNSKFTTFNYGINGLNTINLPELIEEKLVDADLVFIQYYINDIMGTAENEGLRYEPIKHGMLEKFLIYSNYTLNYFLTRNFLPSSPSMGYKQYIHKLVENENIWNQHINEIVCIKEICDNKKTPFIFIVYPYLIDFTLTDLYFNKLFLELDKLDIKYIKVGDIIIKNNIPKAQRVVNKFDEHPSVLLNHYVAEEILENWIDNY